MSHQFGIVGIHTLLHGVHRAAKPAQRRWREALDTVIARIHARVSAELALEGTPVGPHDPSSRSRPWQRFTSLLPMMNGAFRKSLGSRFIVGDSCSGFLRALRSLIV